MGKILVTAADNFIGGACRQARSLVIGLGSIGQRHARLLTEAGCAVAVASRRGGADYQDIAAAIAGHRPDYVVVATETAGHARVLAELAEAGYGGRLAIEKPLFETARPFPWTGFGRTVVAYPLRCHPAVRRLKDLLDDQPVLAAQIYVGQYLPDWRPDRDYRDTYSAHAAQGGGALRDLSHELDLANWLLGPWQSLTARGGQWSKLEIDSDDVFVLMTSHRHCRAATIHLNYLDRRLRRSIVLHTAHHSYALDLVASTLRRDGDEPESFDLERDTMFRAFHHAVLSGDDAHLCDLDGGLRVMDMIAAAERSTRDGGWQHAAGQP